MIAGTELAPSGDHIICNYVEATESNKLPGDHVKLQPLQFPINLHLSCLNIMPLVTLFH